MTYIVKITPRAESDILDAVEYIAVDALSQAEIWFNGIYRLMNSLVEMPERFEVAPDSKYVGERLHHAT